jgi:PAS domain S-box-containing protein
MFSAIDFERFVQVAGDAVIAVGTDGKITLWNMAAERIFGYSGDEMLGKSLDLIIPERFRERHWQGFREVAKSGRSKYGADVLRVPALHKDGRPLSIAFTVALLSAAGRVDSIVAIVRDETQRWQDERELRRRLTELEQASAKNRPDNRD